MRVAVICFANTCRSPVAEAQLELLLRSEPHVQIVGRGLEGHDGTTPEAMATVLSERGLSLVSPSGETLGKGDLDSDLLLYMERALLREAVVRNPATWARSFTLREFVRRGQLNPPEKTKETFAEWVAVLHASRTREELMGNDRSDDVEDPGLIGSEEDFRVMVETLDGLTQKAAQLLSGWPSAR